ncbi:3-deoxy-manno-octulosonate cytidylyltransferase [Granulosicoccaceae sp. 1_MG-2023]|nr:3-deoxy-manno-octulosonate cytidylyltransferase [Granulosicoccaceae sp. 1_MG-2023]
MSNNKPEFYIVIPARYDSSRFPGKPLADIHGRPMIAHVIDCARACGAMDVVVATDDERVAAAVKATGTRVCMTSAAHPSGTDRIAEVAVAENWDDSSLVVNLQGDEPLTPAAVVRQVAANLAEHEWAGIATLCTPISSLADFRNPNIVKVVAGEHGRALYFSRAPVPFVRDAPDSVPPQAARHIGIYAYRVGFLRRWQQLSESPLEKLEKLEQLRAMEAGVAIHVATAAQVPPHGVDTPEQLDAVIRFMADS